MCEHNEKISLPHFALLIAFMEIIPHFPPIGKRKFAACDQVVWAKKRPGDFPGRVLENRLSLFHSSILEEPVAVWGMPCSL